MRKGPRGGSRTPWPVRLALMSWPAGARERDGPAIVQAVLDAPEYGAGGPLRRVGWLLAECASIAMGGVHLRAAGLRSTPSRWLVGSWMDVRFGLRSMSRHGAFTLMAVTTLAVGIGGGTAVLELVDDVLFRPLPYPDADRLVLVWNTLGNDPGRIPMVAPDADVLRRESASLAEVAFVGRTTDGGIQTLPDAAARHVLTAAVTPNLFDLLGATPALGRTFGPAATSDASEVILSWDTWMSTMEGDPSAVGRSIRLNGQAATVIGVLGRDFRLHVPPDVGVAPRIDVWVPLDVPLATLTRDDGRRTDRDSDNSGAVIGRTVDRVTLEDVSADMTRIGAELRRRVPEYATADLRIAAGSLDTEAHAASALLFQVLLAATAGMLLVTCLNVATLLFSQGMRRTPELAVRMALGAGRAAILRQVAIHNFLIVVMGALLGGALAVVAIRGLVWTLPPGLDPTPARDVGPGAWGLVATASALVVLGFGSTPVLRALAKGTVGTVRARPAAGLRRSIVLVQMAMAVTLVFGAGLLARTAAELGAVEPGFDPDGALVFDLSLRDPIRYAGPADRAAVVRDVETGVAELPGVGSVGLVAGLPLSGSRWIQPYGLPGQAEHEWEANRADFRVITSGYFDAIGADLIAGRGFSRREDLVEDGRVVVVDEVLAARLGGARAALGAQVGIPLDGRAVQAEVVGVVGHIRHEDLATEGREAVYVPFRQEASRDVSIVVRTVGDPLDVASQVRSVVEAIDPQLPVYNVQALSTYVRAATASTRFGLGLTSGFALLAILAAGVGLYGVVAQDVASRRREFGVRLAVGATSDHLLATVVRQGAALAVPGLGVGLAVAWVAVQGARPLLHGVGFGDLKTWSGVLALVFATAMIACWVPARRASRQDPSSSLRAD